MDILEMKEKIKLLKEREIKMKKEKERLIYNLDKIIVKMENKKQYKDDWNVFISDFKIFLNDLF